MNSQTAQKLKDLGVSLPDATPAGGRYLSSTSYRGVAYFSGKIARTSTGRLGAELSLADGIVAARDAALSLLAAMESEVGLDNVIQVLKLTGFVASANGFDAQPAVIDAASSLIVDVLSERGRHARSAVGVAWLPRGAPVEVEAVVAVADSPI